MAQIIIEYEEYKKLIEETPSDEEKVEKIQKSAALDVIGYIHALRHRPEALVRGEEPKFLAGDDVRILKNLMGVR